MPGRHDNICYQMSGGAMPDNLFFPGQLIFDPAEMHRSNPKVRGNVVLRYPLNDVRSVFDEINIALDRSVPDPGEEFVHVMPLPLERDLHQGLQKIRVLIQFLQHGIEHRLRKDLNNARLNGLYRKGAGDILLKTFQGGNTFVLKKKLKGRILFMIVKPHPETTLFDEIVILSDLAFPQQGRLRGVFYPLLQRGIFLPIRVQVGKTIFERK
jgi:hypothetical protein